MHLTSVCGIMTVCGDEIIEDLLEKVNRVHFVPLQKHIECDLNFVLLKMY